MRHFNLDCDPRYRNLRPAPKERARRQAERDMFGEWGKDVLYWQDTDHKFRAGKPLSFEDAEGGGFCSRSGFWFPARRLIRSGGVAVGDAFYREERDG